MSLAIVHIGLPKTGTTSFQLALDAHASELSARGVHVMVFDGPDDQLAVRTRAFDLANCVVRRDLDVWWVRYLPQSLLPEFVERGRRSIRAQAARPEPLLVASVEDLCLVRTSEEVERLRDLLAPRTVQVVVTVRDRATWARSLRVQLAEAGIRTDPRYPSSCSNLRPDSWLLDLDALVEVFERTLGPGSVTVVDTDGEVARSGSVLPALWRACRLPEDLLDEPRTTTPSAGRGWANPSLASTGDLPLPGAPDELEQLRDRAIRQAYRIAALETERAATLRRRLARRVRRSMGRPLVSGGRAPQP